MMRKPREKDIDSRWLDDVSGAPYPKRDCVLCGVEAPAILFKVMYRAEYDGGWSKKRTAICLDCIQEITHRGFVEVAERAAKLLSDVRRGRNGYRRKV